MGLHDRRDRYVHGIWGAVFAELKAFELDGNVLPRRSFDQHTKLRRLAVVGHVKQAQAGIAERMGQILMGRAVEMPYFTVFIDQNDAGIEMPQQHLLVKIREVDRVLLLEAAVKNGGRSGAQREIG